MKGVKVMMKETGESKEDGQLLGRTCVEWRRWRLVHEGQFKIYMNISGL